MSGNTAFYTVAGLIVALVGTFATILTIPEMREFFGLSNEPTPPGEPTALQTDYSDSVGVYTGQSTNKTMRAEGTTTLDIRDIQSPYGNARANVEWGGNLNGNGNLSGTVSQDGSMDLSGDVHSCVPPNCVLTYIWDADLDCEFGSRNEVDCTYTLSPRQGNTSGKQEGQMKLTKR